MSLYGYYSINSNDTKKDIISKFEEMKKDVYDHLKDIETSSLYQHFNMQSELLKLYRTLYNNNNMDDVKLDDFEDRLEKMENDFEKYKEIYSILTKNIY